MLLIHVVRHGESTDNLKSLWAGHKDAALSNHGMEQAKRVGQSFASTPVARIYSSDLKRAHWTALQIHGHQTASASAPTTPSRSAPGPEGADATAGPSSILTTDGEAVDEAGEAADAPDVRRNTDLPPPITTQLLREQHFGAAEGQSWANGAWTHTDWGDYRHRFEGGESLNDVGARADRIVEHVVLPWAHEAARRDEDVVVVIVAHGIMISQLGQSLIRHSTTPAVASHFGGLLNTSYHTFSLRLDPHDLDYDHPLPPDGLPPPYPDAGARYALRVERLAEAGHLAGLKRQKAGIGSTAYDPKQRSMKDFFAGKPAPTSPSPKRTARA